MRRAVLGSGNISPERLAAERLRSLFTFVAAQEVLDQLRGSGRGDLGSHDPIGYADLESHMVQQKLSEKNSEEWLHALAETNSRIAARVMETRAAYGAADGSASSQFEWENCRQLTGQLLSEGNTVIMRAYLSKLDGLLGSEAGGQDDPGDGGTQE